MSRGVYTCCHFLSLHNDKINKKKKFLKHNTHLLNSDVIVLMASVQCKTRLLLFLLHATNKITISLQIDFAFYS